MVNNNKKIDEQILLAKSKLLPLRQEQEILQEIQDGNYNSLEILTDSYAYSVLKTIKQQGIFISNYQRCISFCCNELKRLAKMEKDIRQEESFTSFVPWWILGALEDYVKMQDAELATVGVSPKRDWIDMLF